MQIAILAGGLATRLRPLTEKIPKSMVPIHGTPFLQYQIELLRSHGVTDIVLCVGHLAERIEAHFGDGARLGVRLRYSREQGALLGTAGALKQAEGLLGDRFFVMYGDSYLMFDYADIMERARTSGTPALMVVYRNRGRYDASNVAVEAGRVARYEKGGRSPELDHIDAGLTVLRRELLDRIPVVRPAALDQDVFPRLVERQELAAYLTQQRFYEIGSPAGLEEFRRLVNLGGIAT